MAENKSLCVLLYHKISLAGKTDYLTVTTTQLEKHLQIIKKNGYNTILFSDLVNYVTHKTYLPPKPLLLTFDDGYKNNYSFAYPLLKRYEMKAGIFLVSEFVQTGYNNHNAKSREYLHINDLKDMDPALIEFALHTVNHENYNNLTIEEIDLDIKKSKSKLKSLQVAFQPCLAYTFGAYPKKDKQKRTKLFQLLEANDIKLAFRIGNRINKLPLKNKFLIQRIEIRGNESLWKFKLALKMGKKFF